MRLLHYLEIRNFKRFGDTQHIELDHPAVLIGPNNCGKTTAIQALALWSQAVRAWLSTGAEMCVNLDRSSTTTCRGGMTWHRHARASLNERARSRRQGREPRVAGAERSEAP